jgi:bile acid:Na+ symporter, BASS family
MTPAVVAPGLASVSPGQLISLTLFTIMLALGLSLQADGLALWRRHSSLLLRVLLGSCLLVPLLGLLLLQTPWSQAINEPARYAIALMAVCPSAPLALRRASQAGGDRQLTAVLQITAALAAIVSVPLLGLAFRHTFAVLGWQIRPLDVALQVGKVQVLPLLLGLLLRRSVPQLAERLEGPLDRLANLLFVLLVSLVLLKAGPLLLTYVPRNLPALLLMGLLAAAALAIGRAMAGAQVEHSLSTALVTGMRNPGLALLLANRHGQDLPGLKLGIVVYVLVTVVVSTPLMQRLRQEPR